MIWKMFVCGISTVSDIPHCSTDLVCLHVEVPHLVPGHHHHLPGLEVGPAVVLPHQVGGPVHVLGLLGGPPVHLAHPPRVDIGVEGGNDGIVHRELDIVECGDLGEE